jgi:hypothetical protein
VGLDRRDPTPPSRANLEHVKAGGAVRVEPPDPRLLAAGGADPNPRPRRDAAAQSHSFTEEYGGEYRLVSASCRTCSSLQPGCLELAGCFSCSPFPADVPIRLLIPRSLVRMQPGPSEKFRKSGMGGAYSAYAGAR